MQTLAQNEIPEMVDPMGRYWEQPATTHIRLDDESATMSQEAFDQLKEYSASNPTSVYGVRCGKPR